MPFLKKFFHFPLILIFFFSLSSVLLAQSDWVEKNSEHFKIVYRSTHKHLVPHILKAAESAYKTLSVKFNNKPSLPIIINTYDINDYGFGAATSIPENFIRLEIEPFEPGYENTPYNERFQWVLNHELVHIFINDDAGNFEKLQRKLFGKVNPLQIQPLTAVYSLSGNLNRYTPRWYQEAPAVFLETWLSGGYGRVLGNFDEMYFRSLALDSIHFPSERVIETDLSHNSFLLEHLFYLYGGRFAAYISIKYGADKFLQWFQSDQGGFFTGYKSKFRDVFGGDFDDEWNHFAEYEIEFQRDNLQRIRTRRITEIEYLSSEPLGWTTQPYLLNDSSGVVFADHRPHNLAAIQVLHFNKKEAEKIINISSPSMFQVASTAFDKSSGLFFYTTNNNQLYRDLNVADISTGETKVLFPDARVGQLTVAAVTKELWGIQHWSGMASLIYSPYPYLKLFHIRDFNIGEEIFNLSVNPEGTELAAVIHKASGEQELRIIDIRKLKTRREYATILISDKGAPENPSWSNDSKLLLWNASLNGVSNIYCYNFSDSSVMPVSNTEIGLFKPVFLNRDSIFAFEFSEKGFYPVKLVYSQAEFLPAIDYLGQNVLKRDAYLADLIVKDAEPAALSLSAEEEYNSFSNINLNTFIPVVTGFQQQVAFGIFTQLNDPLINHDIITEIAYAPFDDAKIGPRFHFKLKYDFMKKYEFGIDHNAADFYDLFNKRKRGMIGTKVRLGYIYYWLYDNPHKIVQKTEAAVYRGIKYINDNLVAVSEPDYIVLQTSWNSKNLRKTIGSSDWEYGDEINFTVMGFGSDPSNPVYAAEVFAEWDRYRLWLFDHNVFHYKLAGGYHFKNERLTQAAFYFGGFGNRLVENVDVKQFRNLFRFPGVPIYSVVADKFVKLLLENNFPPVRFKNLSIGQQLFNHLDFSVYSELLFMEEQSRKFYVDAGAQINLVLKHWYNLESTLSFGVAQAWCDDFFSPDWFFSIKLLKN